MLTERVLAALVMAAIGIPAIILGGAYYFAIIVLFLGVAAWEYGRLFRNVDRKACEPLLVGSVVLLIATRFLYPDLASMVLTLSILAAMTWHLIDYERGREQAGTDFAVTVSGIIYLGWIGAYLVDLRNLPNGLWWLLLVLPSVWMADTAAYFIGRYFGKHPFSPRLSPKKTWEGYLAGVVFGTIGTAGLAILWRHLGGPATTWWKGAVLGAALSILTPLGDLGESMLKRQAGVKNSSNIIPGHGGVFDRIDSWLWGSAIGYFLVIWFLI